MHWHFRGSALFEVSIGSQIQYKPERRQIGRLIWAGSRPSLHVRNLRPVSLKRSFGELAPASRLFLSRRAEYAAQVLRLPTPKGSSLAPNICGWTQHRVSLAKRQFHRGSQAEPTCPVSSGKAARYQRLTKPRSSRAGFFAGSTLPEARQRKPIAEKPLDPRVFFI